MITDINDVIKNYLQDVLEHSTNDIDFSMLVPTKKFSESVVRKTVNIYLLDVKENLQQRQNEWDKKYTSDGKVENSAPPVMLDLYYVITCYADDNDIEKEHELFIDVLRGLYRFSSFFQEHLSSDFIEVASKMALELFPQKYIDEHLGHQFWSAIDQNARPLISIKVTIPLDISYALSSTIVKVKEINYSLESKLYDIKGRVTTKLNATTEVPVLATLKLKKEGDDEIIQLTKCDALGLYTLSHLNKEKYTVDIIADGYKTQSISMKDIKELSARPLNIVLEKV